VLGKPVIGFFGLVSGDWIDFALLDYMAARHPEWSIVLIGKYADEAPALLRRKNIHLLGPRPYELLPACCKAFDVAIIPFVLSELTRNSNPLKLKEYLAAGVPVVSTKLPEVEHYRGTVGIGEDHRRFVAAVEEALKKERPAMRAARSAAVKQDSWEARFGAISGLVAAGR
jgi:glycosyltransferase involved in cell wall biosynthesis